jgi:butyrate kinase
MYDLHRCLDLQLRAIDKPKPTLIIPEADDARLVEAAERLTKFANVVLLAPEDKLRYLVRRSGLDERFQASAKRLFRLVRCVDIEAEAELREEFAQTYVKLGLGKKWESDLERAREAVLDPVTFAVLATRLGYADMVIGGVTHSSKDFFHPCLRLLERQEVVYEMALFALPDEHVDEIYEKNLALFADVALNPVPTPEALARIAVGSCKTMRDIIPPEDLTHINCALLSYSTRGSGEGPSVERIRKAGELIPGMLENLCREDPVYASIRIDTELQISVAVSKAAAKTKLGEDFARLKAAGRASVLIAPNLDVGNLLYHIYAARYPSSQHLMLIGGLHNRALDFSRSSTADDVVLGGKGLILRNLKSRNYRPTPNDYFFPRYRVLSINPGSTSTKVALFEGDVRVFEIVERHDANELGALGSVAAQRPLREEVVERVLRNNKVEPGALDAVVARGGLVHPLKSGTYTVCDDMLADLESSVYGEHPSNLGAPLASTLAKKYGVPALVVDPPVVDELDDASRITGMPGVERQAAWHALNQKACAKRYCEERGKEYDQINLIVCHMGGGVSVGAHRAGRCVFVRNALYDGPMTAQRVGTLPQRELIDLCYHTPKRELLEGMIIRQGGMMAHLGTSDLRRVEQLIDNGDEKAALVFEAMAQQIAMEICAAIPKFLGEPVEHIILTGGMAYSKRLTARLEELLRQVSIPVLVWPGEDELEALRDGAVRVLAGHEAPLEYRKTKT